MTTHFELGIFMANMSFCFDKILKMEFGLGLSWDFARDRLKKNNIRKEKVISEANVIIRSSYDPSEVY